MGAALNEIGVEASVADIEAAYARARSMKTRFNVGIIGRGRQEMSEEQLARIDRLIAHHGDRLRPLLSNT